MNYDEFFLPAGARAQKKLLVLLFSNGRIFYDDILEISKIKTCMTPEEKLIFFARKK